MPVRKSQQACVNRYISKNYDRINVTVPKGDRDRYKRIAADLGVSVNQLFINGVESLIADRLIDGVLPSSASSDTTESTE